MICPTGKLAKTGSTNHQVRSPEGAKRNPGSLVTPPDFASLHPGYGIFKLERDRDAAAPYAALMFAMKRSSSSRSLVLSLERVLAEFSTSSEAEPVSVAPRLTCMMLAAACWVPWATV